MALFKSTFASQHDSGPDLTYLLKERVSKQWLGFLGVLSEELESQLSPDDYREFLQRMGGRFAQAHALPECDTMKDLESSINQIWESMRWGYCELNDGEHALLIKHVLCPLPEALGVDAQMAGGFMEGVYEAWLHAAGAEPELQVKQTSSASSAHSMTFEFGHA